MVVMNISLNLFLTCLHIRTRLIVLTADNERTKTQNKKQLAPNCALTAKRFLQL